MFKEITDDFEKQHTEALFPLFNEREMNRINAQLELCKEMALKPIQFAANIGPIVKRQMFECGTRFERTSGDSGCCEKT